MNPHAEEAHGGNDEDDDDDDDDDDGEIYFIGKRVVKRSEMSKIAKTFDTNQQK